MKFTIESFKSSVYRPAEWLMQNDAITHLFSDYNKQFEGIDFSYGASGDGNTFFINVYKYLAEKHLSEDECCCLKVSFLPDDKVEFEENFEDLFKLPSEAKDYGVNYFMPYWTCVGIQKKITQTIFKAISGIQEYPRLQPRSEDGAVEVIKVSSSK